MDSQGLHELKEILEGASALSFFYSGVEPFQIGGGYPPQELPMLLDLRID